MEMSEAAIDPYAVLGVAPDVTDIELRRVYRGLVKRHHPDHNGNTAESARHFAQIQNAYALITQRRRGLRQPSAQGGSTGRSTTSDQGASTGGSTASDQGASTAPGPGAATPGNEAATDPAVEDRIASLERELALEREAERRAREQARVERERAAKLAAQERVRMAPSHRLRATPEELGYHTTDDSFTKIIDDAAEQLAQRLRGGEAKKQFARRLSDIFGRED